MSEVESEATIAEQDQRPSWLPDNFRSGEDLARSYKEAQAALTRTNQELNTVKSQVDEILAAQVHQAQQAQYSDSQSQLVERWESGSSEDQLATMAWLAQEAAKQAIAQQQANQQPVYPENQGEILADIADRRMAEKYSDWNEIKVSVADLVREDPALLQVGPSTPPAQVVRDLERAYKIVKANLVLSQTEEVQQQGEAENRLIRQQAQTISGASQRPATVDPETEYWEAVKSTPVGTVRLGRL